MIYELKPRLFEDLDRRRGKLKDPIDRLSGVYELSFILPKLSTKSSQN